MYSEIVLLLLKIVLIVGQAVSRRGVPSSGTSNAGSRAEKSAIKLPRISELEPPLPLGAKCRRNVEVSKRSIFCIDWRARNNLSWDAVLGTMTSSVPGTASLALAAKHFRNAVRGKKEKNKNKTDYVAQDNGWNTIQYLRIISLYFLAFVLKCRCCIF